MITCLKFVIAVLAGSFFWDHYPAVSIAIIVLVLK